MPQGRRLFAFGIGGDDTVALHSADGAVLDTTTLDGSQDLANQVWTRTDGTWTCKIAVPAETTQAPATTTVVSAVMDVIITAVANKGTADKCSGEEWVALANTGASNVAIDGFMLTDGNGREDDDALTFGSGVSIAANSKMVLCRKADFEFKIGGNDTVTLWDAAGAMVDTTTLDGSQDLANQVWTRTGDAWTFVVGWSAKQLQLVAVSDKGSEDKCGGKDWISLSNSGESKVYLKGYMLTDNKGRKDADAFNFGSGSFVGAGATVVLCKDSKNSFVFGIGDTDTVTLWDADGNLADTTTLDGKGVFNKVWAWSASKYRWGYTTIGKDPLPVCMNGKLEAGEECDAGAPTPECSGKCKRTCTPKGGCGTFCLGGAMNGVREAGEECDSGTADEECLCNCRRAASEYFADAVVPDVTITVSNTTWEIMASCMVSLILLTQVLIMGMCMQPGNHCG